MSSQGIDFDQMLDWKYKMGSPLEAPAQANRITTAEDAKSGIIEQYNKLQKKATAGIAAAGLASVAFAAKADVIDLNPATNFEMYRNVETPIVRTISDGNNAKGIIENYIDQHELFKN